MSSRAPASSSPSANPASSVAALAPSASRGAADGAVHAAIRLRSSLSHLTRQLRALAAPDGPGAAKLGVLGQLYRLGAMSPTRLAQHERVRLQTLTRLLAELEAEKLIRRRPHPSDARQTLLSIAAAGVRVLTTDIHRREASLAAVIAGRLATAEQVALVAACRLLDRLGDGLADASVATGIDADANGGAMTDDRVGHRDRFRRAAGS